MTPRIGLAYHDGCRCTPQIEINTDGLVLTYIWQYLYEPCKMLADPPFLRSKKEFENEWSACESTK